MGESYSDDLIVQIICIGYVDQRVEFITFLLVALMRQYNYICQNNPSTVERFNLREILKSLNVLK